MRRVVAIKAVSPGLVSSPTSRARFQREAQSIAAIDHDHVVPVYRVGEQQSLPYVMPLLEGETLHGRLQRGGSLSVAGVRRLGYEIALALARRP